MKKIFNACVMTLGLLRTEAQQTDLEVLKKLNAKFIHNFVTGDTASHSGIIHRDFIHVSSTGKYTARKDYLENWAHGFNGIMYWDYRDEDIRIFGNTALIHSQNKCITIENGKEVMSFWMYTDTYIKENGEWKCIQAQIAMVAPEYYAADETILRKYDLREKKDGDKR
jgi:hypothetical protein